MTARLVVRDGYTDDLCPMVMRLFADEWWTRDRTAEDVDRALRASDLLFTVTDNRGESVVGFARVLTDFRYLALVLDVITAASHRGRGIGTLLMDTVTSHARLRDVESLELVCQPDVRDFYGRWGFTSDVGQSRLMRRSAGGRR